MASGRHFAFQSIGVSPESTEELTTEDRITVMLWLAAFQLIATAIGLVVIAVRYGYAPRVLSVQLKNILPDIKIGLISFLIVVPLILILQIALAQLVAYDHPTINTLLDGPTSKVIGVTWLSAVIVAPICEEVFFRGILQNWLQRTGYSRDLDIHHIVGGWKRLDGEAADDKNVVADTSVEAEQTRDNPYESFNIAKVPPESKASNRYQPKLVFWDSTARFLPILISSLLFAAVHFGQGLAYIPLFFFGIALGYIYRQTGSIIPCIMLHMLLNGFSMFWLTIQVVFAATT